MTTITIARLARMLIERDIPADEQYVAAAGQDYGQVRAWVLPGSTQWLIAYGDNGQTNYALADEADDLCAWLLSSDLNDEDQIIQQANTLSAEAIEAAPTDTDRALVVLVTRSYYGPSERSDLARDLREQVIRFAHYAAAQDWIEEAKREAYVCAHNESDRPSYKIVEI